MVSIDSTASLAEVKSAQVADMVAYAQSIYERRAAVIPTTLKWKSTEKLIGHWYTTFGSRLLCFEESTSTATSASN